MDFSLRKWAGTDVPALVKYANNESVASNLRDGFPHPYTASDAESFLRDFIGSGEESGFCRAIDVGGEAAGSIGIFLKNDVYRKSAEIGYWLGEPFWGNGIITGAIGLICDEAFGRYDIVRIFAEPYSYNIGSRKALEKAGFTLEGTLRKSVYKNGKLYDSCIYAVIKE